MKPEFDQCGTEQGRKCGGPSHKCEVSRPKRKSPAARRRAAAASPVQSGSGLVTTAFGEGPTRAIRAASRSAALGAAHRAEFASGGDAHESGLSFAISEKSCDFSGKAALERNAKHPRRVLKGLKFETNDVPAQGAHVFAAERPIGVITSAARSPMFGCSIAMARLSVEYAESGTALEVGQMDGHMKRLSATVCDLPFYDPKRARARA